MMLSQLNNIIKYLGGRVKLCQLEQNFITEEESEEFQNVKISHEARIRGFNDDLYYPSPEDRKYFSLGNYVKSVVKAYSSNKISVGKKDELLLDGFRGDLTFKKK